MRVNEALIQGMRPINLSRLIKLDLFTVVKILFVATGDNQPAFALTLFIEALMLFSDSN